MKQNLSLSVLATLALASCGAKKDGPAAAAPTPPPACVANLEIVTENDETKEINRGASNRDLIVTKKEVLAATPEKTIWRMLGRSFDLSKAGDKNKKKDDDLVEDFYDLKRLVTYSSDDHEEFPIAIRPSTNPEVIRLGFGGNFQEIFKPHMNEMKTSMMENGNVLGVEDLCGVDVKKLDISINRQTDRVHVESIMTISLKIKDPDKLSIQFGLAGHEINEAKKDSKRSRR